MRPSDCETYLDRLLRPERPRRDEAQRAVEGLLDPAEAWETLAARGVIPVHWVGDGARAFAAERACEGCRGRGCDECYGRGRAVTVTRDPPSVRTCVAFAANPEGVATAEALAREASARLAPWGVDAARRCVWHGARDDEWRPGDDPFAGVRAELLASLPGHACERARAVRDHVVRRVPTGGRRPWAVVERFADHAWGAALWDERAGLGNPWGGRADPFTPAMDLWATGYAIHALASDAITLVTPEL